MRFALRQGLRAETGDQVVGVLRAANDPIHLNAGRFSQINHVGGAVDADESAPGAVRRQILQQRGQRRQ